MTDNSVTHVRILEEDKKLLSTLAHLGEDHKTVLHKILKDYRKRGIPREIVDRFEELQHICVKYIHPDLIYSLEMMKAHLIKAYRSDQVKRSQIAKMLSMRLEFQSALEIFEDQKKADVDKLKEAAVKEAKKHK